jgi:hypothetical protein
MISLKRNLNTAQIFGSGLALILLSLLLYIFLENRIFLNISLGLTIFLMIWPTPFKYFGYLWFAFGEALGYIVSRIILSVVYIVLVIPVGLMKRAKIRRNMQLNVFKRDTSSVFKPRNYHFSDKDFDKPF